MNHQTQHKTLWSVIIFAALMEAISMTDYMMVMPLGPFFLKALHIKTTDIGYVGGVYLVAASFIGIVAAQYLDRFDRRKAALFATMGLSVATFIATFSTGLYSLLTARIIAGFFGGPSTALATALVIDAVAEEHRGRAFGVLMGSFSIASVMGVPFGLFIAYHWSWKAPFYFVSMMGLVLFLVMWMRLPSMRAHLIGIKNSVDYYRILWRKPALLAHGMIALSTLSLFVLVPNLTPYFAFNRHFPLNHLSGLFIIAGLITLIGMILAGYLTDRIHPVIVVTTATMIMILTVIFELIVPNVDLPIPLFFIAYMSSVTAARVPLTVITTRVPSPEERAGFMSIQNSMVNLCSGLGAFLSSLILVAGPGGAILHIERAAYLSVIMAFLLPFLAVLTIDTLIQNR